VLSLGYFFEAGGLGNLLDHVLGEPSNRKHGIPQRFLRHLSTKNFLSINNRP